MAGVVGLQGAGPIAAQGLSGKAAGAAPWSPARPGAPARPGVTPRAVGPAGPPPRGGADASPPSALLGAAAAPPQRLPAPPGALASGSPSDGWASEPEGRGEPLRRTLDRAINLGVLAAGGAALAAQLLQADVGAWELYQRAVEANPLETKAAISGFVYAAGDLIAQAYEGRGAADWDRGRALRSGAVGFLAHGPLSHLYYLGLDAGFHAHGAALGLAPGSLAEAAAKIAVDQTAWSLAWNAAYAGLLGALRLEPPAAIAAAVRGSAWDLLRAGWRVWPLVHVVTYGVVPVQHRLLFVDAAELAWCAFLSAYGQRQRAALRAAAAACSLEAGAAAAAAAAAAGAGGAAAAAAAAAAACPPGPVACVLPAGGAGGGGDPAEEMLRGVRAEREVVFEDAAGGRTVLAAEAVWAGAMPGRELAG